jgi:uncharacterized protein (DUF433 family)
MYESDRAACVRKSTSNGDYSRIAIVFGATVSIAYFLRMNSDDLITVDPEILGGTPVFKGTRVPVKTLFDYLEDNYTLGEFLKCFPTVSLSAARKALERSETALLSNSVG